MPKTYSHAQLELLRAIKMAGAEKMHALAAHDLARGDIERTLNLELSRNMNKALLAKIPKAEIARHVGLSNFHTLRDLYALAADQFKTVDPVEFQAALEPYQEVEFISDYSDPDTGAVGSAIRVRVVAFDAVVDVFTYVRDVFGPKNSYRTEISTQQCSISDMGRYNVRVREGSIPQDGLDAMAPELVELYKSEAAKA